MEGFSVSGGPAVLWSHPLPGGMVSACGEGGRVCTVGLSVQPDG